MGSIGEFCNEAIRIRLVQLYLEPIPVPCKAGARAALVGSTWTLVCEMGEVGGKICLRPLLRILLSTGSGCEGVPLSRLLSAKLGHCAV